MYINMCVHTDTYMDPHVTFATKHTHVHTQAWRSVEGAILRAFLSLIRSATAAVSGAGAAGDSEVGVSVLKNEAAAVLRGADDGGDDGGASVLTTTTAAAPAPAAGRDADRGRDKGGAALAAVSAMAPSSSLSHPAKGVAASKAMTAAPAAPLSEPESEPEPVSLSPSAPLVAHDTSTTAGAKEPLLSLSFPPPSSLGRKQETAVQAEYNQQHKHGAAHSLLNGKGHHKGPVHPPPSTAAKGKGGGGGSGGRSPIFSVAYAYDEEGHVGRSPPPPKHHGGDHDKTGRGGRSSLS